MKTDKLRIKDIITVTLLSLINIIIFSLGTFLYATPITLLLMPVFYSLLQGMVFFMIGVKVRKKGAMLLYCVIQGILGFNIPYIVVFILAGIIAELILAKTGYANTTKGLTISYILMQLLACVGNTIYPYAITLNATMSGLENEGNLDSVIGRAGEMIQSWGCAILALTVVLGAFIGAMIGKRVVKKHLMTEETA